MKKIFIVAIVLMIVGVIGWSIGEQNSATSTNMSPDADPIDVTLDFYHDWLSLMQGTAIDKSQADLLTRPVLSEELRATLRADVDEAASLDPVLCQTLIPQKIGVKTVFELDDSAQILVLARGGEEKLPEQALVTLGVVGNIWQIQNIECISGETAPVREYSFEREGHILKTSLDAQYWHLVFEQNGQKGHTVPLFFDAVSLCDMSGSGEVVCDEGVFTEATKVRVQGEMTESGVEVKRLRLVEE